MSENANIESFYHHFALLSMSFAKMEYDIFQILSQFITNDFVISSVLFDKNNLEKNLETLKSLNRYKNFESEKLDTIIKNIRDIKSKRNLFIHGYWLDPREVNGEITCAVYDHRTRFAQEGKLKNWTKGQFDEFSLNELKQIIEKIEHILGLQKEFLDLLAEKGERLRTHSP